MRIPRPELRLRCLPEEVLRQALAAVGAYAEAAAKLFRSDPEDLVEAAGLGAWVAWETYDPAAGTLWSTWLRRNVNWFVAEMARDWGKARHKDRRAFAEQFTVISLHQQASRADEDDQPLLEEITEDPHAAFEQRLLDRLEAEELLAQMLPRERRVFTERYLLAVQKAEVARGMAISQARISQLEAQVRTRLTGERLAHLERANLPLPAPDPDPVPCRRPVPGPLEWTEVNAVTWTAPGGWEIKRNSKTRLYRLSRRGTVLGYHPHRRAAITATGTALRPILRPAPGRMARPAAPLAAPLPPPAAPPPRRRPPLIKFRRAG